MFCKEKAKEYLIPLTFIFNVLNSNICDFSDNGNQLV